MKKLLILGLLCTILLIGVLPLINAATIKYTDFENGTINRTESTGITWTWFGGGLDRTTQQAYISTTTVLNGTYSMYTNSTYTQGGVINRTLSEGAFTNNTFSFWMNTNKTGASGYTEMWSGTNKNGTYIAYTLQQSADCSNDRICTYAAGSWEESVHNYVANTWIRQIIIVNSTGTYFFLNNESTQIRHIAGVTSIGTYALQSKYGYFDDIAICEGSDFNCEAGEAVGIEILITLNAPSNNTVLSETGTYFNTTYNISTSDFNWTNTTYHIWYENGTLFNSTTLNISNQNNFTSQFIDDFILGTYIHNTYACYGNATFSNCTWGDDGNFSFVVGATIDNEDYDPFVYETEYTYFILNLSLLPGATIYDQDLIYNETSYNGNLTDLGSDDYTLSLNMDVPLLIGTVSENRTFFWSITFQRGDGTFFFQNLTSNQQNVSRILLTSCASGTTTLNLTTWNEENITRRLLPFDFYGTFNYWLGAGNIYKNLSVSNSSINESVFCLNLNETFYINAHIQYEKISFVKRNYYLINATLTNITEHLNLFFLNLSQSTSFIVEVKDQNQLPIQQAYLYFQRYYPGTGNFETVEMGRTDTTGSTVGHFEAETEDYKVIIVKDGEVLFESGTQKIFCRETPCTIIFQIQAVVGTEWQSFGDVSNLIWTLEFNETSKIWTYVYVDTSGLTQYGRLYVFYERGTGQVDICNTNTTSSSATLSCNVTGYEGKTIYAAAYISRSPEILVYLKSIVVEGLKSIFGLEGLVLSMFILLLLGLAGLWNPAVGIILIIVGMVTLNLIGLASFGAVTISGVIFIALLLLWELKT